MRIFQKLSLGFLVMALFVGTAAYFAIGDVSQKALEKIIGESAALLVRETLDKIDREIYHRIEMMQETGQDLSVLEALQRSNQAFEAMEGAQAYITRQDEEWRALPKETVTPFMQALIEDPLSAELRKTVNFYENRYRYKVYAEMLLANKFGANIAQTDKTTDYFQADETCFQKADEIGLWVEGVGFDESSQTHSIDFCTRIDDERGDLLGTLKVVVNIEDAINIVKELELQTAAGIFAMDGRLAPRFTLVDGAGKVIYATKPQEAGYPTLEKALSGYFVATGEAVSPGYVVSRERGKEELLLAHAHSKGYKAYRGLGWDLIVAYETKEIFAPVHQLKNIVLLIIIGLTLILVVSSLLLARVISTPLLRLKDSALEIGKGRLGVRVDIRSKDEIGVLAAAFNKMTEDLRTTTVSKDYMDNIIGTMTDSLIVVDLNGIILKVNEAACRILGYTREEMVGRAIFTVFSSEKMMSGWSVKRLIQEGVIKDYELLYKSKDGRTIPMLLCGAVLKSRERPDDPSAAVGVVFVAKDISDRRRCEDLTVAMEQAEAALKAKSQFLAKMAQDIQTPVNAVVRLAGQLIGTSMDAAQKDQILSIQRKAQDALAITGEIMDISKIEGEESGSKTTGKNGSGEDGVGTRIDA